MSMFNCMDRPAPAAKRRKLTYERAYRSWWALLSNKCMYLFEWSGLPEPMKQREIEFRLQFNDNASAVFTQSKRYKRLIVAGGSGYGVTEYPDMYTDFIWTCPGDAGSVAIMGKDPAGVMMRNNSTCLPTKLLVDRYAHLLAHAELSLQAILINSRTTGILAAKDDKQRNAIMDFYAALEDGRTLAIVDDVGLDTLVGSEGLRQISTTYPSSVHILDFWQARQNLYKEFLAEIGISKSTDKRERLITDEVAQDQPMYQYALDDMLQQRREAAEKINDLYGLSISVNINPAIKSESQEVATNETERNGSSGTSDSDSGDSMDN